MRLGMLETPQGRQVALVHDGGAVPLRHFSPQSLPAAARTAPTMEALLALGPPVLRKIKAATADAAALRRTRRTAPRWHAPLTAPQKICGIGLNYLDHCREAHLEPPKNPVLFAKYPSAIIGPGDEIRWSRGLSEKIDWEAELGVVIGQKASNVPKAKALDHVAGYVCANDVSARDLQRSDGQFVRSKSIDTFCPLGPWLVTADEIPDPQRLRISCRVNGVAKQDSTTGNMVFGVADLISYLSRAFTFLPGDLILTGTPAGVGAWRNPPEFLRDGDRVEVEVEGLGVLSNTCKSRP